MSKDTIEGEFAPALEKIAWLMVEGARTHRKGEWREMRPSFTSGEQSSTCGYGKMVINGKIIFSTPRAA